MSNHPRNKFSFDQQGFSFWPTQAFHRHMKYIYNQLAVEKQSFQRLTSRFQGGRADETAEKGRLILFLHRSWFDLFKVNEDGF